MRVRPSYPSSAPSSRARRPLAVAVVLAMALGVLGLTGARPASAAPVDVLPTGNATWGIRDSYRNYLIGSYHNLLTHGVIVTSDGAVHLDGPTPTDPPYPLAKGPIQFPVSGGTFDPTTLKGTIELDGRVETKAHPTADPAVWIMDLVLSDLKVEIDGNHAWLTADVEFRPFVDINPNPVPPKQVASDVRFGSVDLTGQSLVPDETGTYTITAAPMVGGTSAMHLIGWDGFYASEVEAGIELAPLTISFTPDMTPPAFVDVPPNHAFYGAITWMAGEGLSTGYDTPAGRAFRPTAIVTRQAVAAFLWRIAGSPDPVPGAPTFSDLPANADFATAIRWMAGEGITTGYADGTFRPTAVVTRQAAAAFIWRLEDRPDPAPGAPSFVDLPANADFATAIRWMAGEGIATGYAGNTFRPTNDVTRQAIASFLYKAFGTLR